MASRKLWPSPLAGAPEQVTLKFRLQYAANAAPDIHLPDGLMIESCTRSGEGVYTLKLSEKFPVFVGGFGHAMVASANFATAGGHQVHIDPADYVASTGVLTYRTGWADGAAGAALVPADIADNDWVYFELTFCRRSTLAPSGAI